jgi:hypothetical protein
MNSGRTVVVQNGNRTSPAGVVIRGARQTVGGAVTVVGSVGCVAGRLLDGAGTVLDTTAGALSGTLLLVGDVLNTTGHVLGSTVSGLGSTLTMAGGLVSGRTIADVAAARAESVPASPAGKPAVATPKKASPGGNTRRTRNTPA